MSKKKSPHDVIITTTRFSVHRRSDNPLYGESVTTVSIGDEAAGGYVVLESNQGHDNGLKLDFDELEQVCVAAKRLQDSLKRLEPAEGIEPTTR